MTLYRLIAYGTLVDMSSGTYNSTCDNGTYGSIVDLTASTGVIKSPGYDDNTYPNNALFQWLIRAPPCNVRTVSEIFFHMKSIVNILTLRLIEQVKRNVGIWHRKSD